MRPPSVNQRDLPLGMVGGNKFGRYPKISDEKTYNMIVSDGWLVDYAGYKQIINISDTSRGRGIFRSQKANCLIAVIGNNVYRINSASPDVATKVGELSTFLGDVYMDENNANQVAISDQARLYIYNTVDNSFQRSVPSMSPGPNEFTLFFIPGFITFQDTRFISPIIGTNEWALSISNDGTDWPDDSQHRSKLETKPDNVVAALRVPGRGNLLFLFGSTVTEIWYDVGAALFPYTRSTTVNIDYGCISANTIAYSDTIVAWLGFNEKSGPVIMTSSGGDIKQISTDGINFKLAQVADPSNSYGIFFKQDGHIFYQLTFPGEDDNFTLIYDFNTQLFSYGSDENLNCHIAQDIAFFNETYYFTSLRDGNIYQMSSNLTTYDYTNPDGGRIKIYDIPRIRVCPTIRLPDNSRFIANSTTFTIEQGNDPYFPASVSSVITAQDGSWLVTQDGYFIGTQQEDEYIPRVDLSLSKDGNESFGSEFPKFLNTLGKRKNRLVYWQLGQANEICAQFKFWGKFRFVVGEGIMSIYQNV